MAAHRKSDRRGIDRCAGGLRRRAPELVGSSDWLDHREGHAVDCLRYALTRKRYFYGKGQIFGL
jgi:hypothetical protein